MGVVYAAIETGYRYEDCYLVVDSSLGYAYL